MKITLIIISILAPIFLIYQAITVMATGTTETQPYKIIQAEGPFEIRYYPAAVMAFMTSASTSYRELGRSGFPPLAGYIFGANSRKQEIAMTSPVHMTIGDSLSSMAFVMPSKMNQDELPRPDNHAVNIKSTEAEHVAALRFGGFASTGDIEKQIGLLKKILQEKGILYNGNFRFLGYNPPYQLFGRRNEVIVSIEPYDVGENKSR